MILAGDIGGTKVNLGLYREVDGRLESVEETRVECSNYSGFEQILDEFIGKTRVRPDRACFGVAGPVKDGACEVTNLSWRIELGRIKEQLGIDHVWLINDLAAMACAVPLLGKDEVEVLQQGTGEAVGRITVLAAGTGLGQAFLAPTGVGRYYALETEGGHCDFAPRNPVEIELLRFLLNEFDRVSIERVLSGSGLYQVYRFVTEYHQLDEPDWLAQELRENDPARVVTENGLNGKSPACKKALELFVGIYGAVAGNLALQLLTVGGVYVGGGIAPKILSLMKGGLFMDGFLSKGRFRSWLERVPVRVILNEGASLLGAAHYALGERFVRP